MYQKILLRHSGNVIVGHLKTSVKDFYVPLTVHPGIPLGK